MLSILSYLRQGDILTAVVVILSRCFVVFCCMPIHELAHGIVADKLGDGTARAQGRLTLDPFKHLDLIGAIMIFLFGIGYAKPVSVNPNRFKNPKGGMALVALAGPVSNLLMGFVYNFIAIAIGSLAGASTLSMVLYYFFSFAASVNVTLAVFNLIPIPPLDGSKILASVLPNDIYAKYMQYERYVMLALMVILFTGVLSGPISFLSSLMMKVISIIPNLIFG